MATKVQRPPSRAAKPARHPSRPASGPPSKAPARPSGKLTPKASSPAAKPRKPVTPDPRGGGHSRRPNRATEAARRGPSEDKVLAGLDEAARAALAWTHGARFMTTAAQLHQLPPPSLPEIAFVGRSNAGKSTAINTLAQERRLAYASKTPGRTQHINLFELGPPEAPDARWADLPGYGYAAVARDAKLRWQQVMADYLLHRHALVGVVMMVDSRHGFTALDRQLLDFVAPRVGMGEVKLLVLLTKADKLSRNEGAKAVAAAQRVLAEVATEHADIGLCLFSALNRQGLGDAATTLRDWVDAEMAAQAAALGPAARAGGSAGDEGMAVEGERRSEDAPDLVAGVGADDGTEHGAVDGVEAGRFDEADQADEPDDDRGR